MTPGGSAAAVVWVLLSGNTKPPAADFTVPATTSLSLPTTVVPMPTCLVADVIQIVSLPMFSVFGIAIVLALTVTVSPAASPSVVLPALFRPVVKSVEPSNARLADAPSRPPELNCTQVFEPAAAAVAVIASRMPVALPSQVIIVLDPAGIEIPEPPPSDCTATV